VDDSVLFLIINSSLKFNKVALIVGSVDTVDKKDFKELFNEILMSIKWWTG
jgi:hypothetical protein